MSDGTAILNAGPRSEHRGQRLNADADARWRAGTACMAPRSPHGAASGRVSEEEMTCESEVVQSGCVHWVEAAQLSGEP
jgi:hypothetical protein